MFYLWRAPDHIASFDFLNRASPFPGSTNPGSSEKVRLNAFPKTE
jgi:hypothetical protein